MDPASGLPDPVYEACEKNARGRPAFRALRGNLTPGTSGREGLGRELLETKKVNPIPWGGALSRMGVVVHSKPVPLGAGKGRGECWVGIPWGSWVPARIYLQKSSQRSPLSLVFLTPLCTLGTGFPKMICFVTTSLQAWHLQLQRPGAWRHFHPHFLGKETRGSRRPGMLQSRATEQLN